MNAKNGATKAQMQQTMDDRTTEQLFSDLAELDRQRTTLASTGSTRLPNKSQRLVYAMIADTISNREGLNDAMDDIFMDDSWEGSYTDALMLAWAMAGEQALAA